MRITLAVADLIPGDIVISSGNVVNGYPHAVPPLPGSLVPMNKNGLNMGIYYGDSETQATVIRY